MELKSFHDRALRLAARGFRVFPLCRRQKRPLPGLKWKERATSDYQKVANWWTAHPESNIGVATGGQFFVVDIDSPAHWAELLVQNGGALPPCPAVRTGKGEHLYFRMPDGFSIGNRAAVAGCFDVRGEGGYVVGAGSIHPDGKPYEWTGAVDVASMPLPPDWLMDLLRRSEAETRPAEAAGTRTKSYAAAALAGVSADVANAPEGQRNATLYRQGRRVFSFVVTGHFGDAEATAALIDAARFAGLPDQEARDTINSARKAAIQAPDDVTPRPLQKSPQGGHGAAPVVRTPQLEVAELSEDALATVFERRHAESLRYCHTAGAWYVWTGTRWQKEATSLAFNWAREICRHFGKGEAKFAKAATASAVERFAAAARCFAVIAEVWDREPWLMGTPAGTLDLRSGLVRDPAPSDHITRLAGSAMATAGTAPARWLAFLEDATRGDAELIRFLQQMAGYALTGDTSEHALFFIYGAGGNGKSVFLNTLSGILGEYATTAAMDTFTASHNDKHPTDLAMLKGARLVSASETEDGRAWAEAKIKQMTGGDPITARFMRQDFFTFRPEFKLVIVGNHKPRLNNVDDATRRRLNIIPFIHKPTTPDPDLERALRDEWPAIFRWMVDGCLDWQAHGLVRPSVVIEATREYFEDQDVFGQWIAESCDAATRFKETNTELFTSWKRYAEAAGELAGSAKAFGEAMRKRGFEPYKSGSARGFTGLRLKPSAAPHDSRFAKDWD